MFRRAVVREPCRNFVHGLTTACLGKPEFETALKQHAAYVHALKTCGLEVIPLAADERYPDSVFVEDSAVVTDRLAVVARPGAPGRRGEEELIADVLKRIFPRIERIDPPGTLEGGDVMRVGDRFFVGLSQRTNEEGYCQFARILEEYGYAATPVPLRRVLHLKTGVSYLENGFLVAAGEFVGHALFKDCRTIAVPQAESYAANSLWINGRVLVPTGFPRTKSAIEAVKIPVVDVDVSEFRKLDGGLSCLSLRF